MKKLIVVDVQREFADTTFGLEEVLANMKLACRPEEHVSAYLHELFGNLFPKHCLKV